MVTSDADGIVACVGFNAVAADKLPPVQPSGRIATSFQAEEAPAILLLESGFDAAATRCEPRWSGIGPQEHFRRWHTASSTRCSGTPNL